MAKFRVNILGCGSATPSARHQPSCQVIDFRDKLFMIDCGEGAQTAFRKMGLKFNRLSHIFISHLHGDHVFGLPGLLSTMGLHQTGGAVTIHVFKEGAKILKQVTDYFCRQSPFEIIYDELTPGERKVIYEDNGITVRTFPLYHRIDCTGFVFEEKPKPRHLIGEMVKFHNIPVARLNDIKNGADFVTENGVVIPNAALTTAPDPQMSYAYCSDTMPNAKIAEDISGVNTVYHEATYDHSLAALARERGHSTSVQAAETARDAGAKQLIIGHFSKRYVEGEQLLLEQAKEIFPNTVLANEGLRMDLL